MVIFILETMVPQVDLEGVSAACAIVSTLPVTVQKLASSMDAFGSLLLVLGAISGLEVGEGVALSRNAIINQSRRNGADGRKNYNGISDVP